MIDPALLWQTVTASPLAIMGYTIMTLVVLETAALAINAENALRRARKDTGQLVDTLGNARSGEIDRLRPLLADYLHHELGQRRFRLFFVGTTAPALGLIFSTAAYTVVLATGGVEAIHSAPEELIANIGTAAGTTALGGVAYILAAVQRMRLENAEDTLRHIVETAPNEASQHAHVPTDRQDRRKLARQ